MKDNSSNWVAISLVITPNSVSPTPLYDFISKVKKNSSSLTRKKFDH